MARIAESPLLAAQQETELELIEFVRGEGTKLAVVKAPPGSGKTSVLVNLAAECFKMKMRVAIGAQTNSQADDICRRLSQDRKIRPYRFASADYDKNLVADFAEIVTGADSIPMQEPVIVVGTIAKWGFATIDDPFDFLVIDEAWQMAWADFMGCNDVAASFIMIGDPGQIPPVVTIDTSRWETSPRAPHRPVPDLILEEPPRRVLIRELRGSRRLPPDSVNVVRGFYDFDFDAWASPGDRALFCEKGSSSSLDRTIDLLRDGSIVALTLPTPDHGPPLELDEELGKTAVQIAKRLLGRSPSFAVKDDKRVRGHPPLTPDDIGLCATHRVMNTFIHLQLDEDLQSRIRVDTPERWQGLERPVMIVVHPLSGVVTPSSFDLETGRLCVMASRHRIGVIVVGRDHVGQTLVDYIPSAAQPIGRPDIVGRGHDRHLRFWSQLQSQGRIVRGV
jgi:hypothetical protein